MGGGSTRSKIFKKSSQDFTYSCHTFHIPLKLLNENYEYQLNYDDGDINNRKFLRNRKYFRSFISVIDRENETGTWKCDSFEFSQFLLKYNLQDKISNIVIPLRTFLRNAVSDADCEKSFRSILELTINALFSI
ncbi:hypothetical protein X975_25542, partial [Stegodyphus mimosarum]